MFSGIVEATAVVTGIEIGPRVVQIVIERPKDFSDLRLGDSICVDGVCLTVEVFTPDSMSFALGPETLRITGWAGGGVKGKVVNLERSLKLGDRMHGHLVTGHVDCASEVLEAHPSGETLDLVFRIPPAIANFVWPKGSIAVNGVSLTVNTVIAETFQVGLIPETLKRTNLRTLCPGSKVNLEADNLARGLVHWAESRKVAGI